MSVPPLRRSTSEGRAIERRETDLLSRLGLDRRATPEEIEAAHLQVTAFLAAAPRALRSWAHVQVAAADEALVLLSDPAALASSAALAAPAPRPAVVPGGPATPPARREDPFEALGTDTPAAEPAESGRLSADELAVLFASVTPSAHRELVRPGGPARADAEMQPLPPVRPNTLSSRSRASIPSRNAGTAMTPRLDWRRGGRMLVAAALVVGALVVAAGVLGFAGTPGATPASSDAAAQAELAAAVGPLMQRIQADPKDAEALMGLGNAFFKAGQYSVAIDWFDKLVALKPADEQALLALGAAAFNSGDSGRAETVWKQVLSLASLSDQGRIEVHYDLGFLYLYRQPPDMDGVKREWYEVVRLAPDSDLAKTVSAHLEAFQSPAPSGSSPAPSGSAPAATATPAASATPAGSPAPSGSSQP